MVGRPRWHKVLADLISSKTRAVLVVLSIAVGVFAVGMVINTYQILLVSSNEGYASINPSSAFVTASDFDQDLVDVIRAMPEVGEADGRRVRTVRLYLRGRWYSTQLSGWQFGEEKLNLLESTAGNAIPDDRQLLIDQTTLFLTDFDVGDTAVVEMYDGRRYEMPIVGMVRDLNSNPSINSGGINAYVTLDTFQWLGDSTGFNRLAFTAVKKQTDLSHMQALTARVKDEIERNGYTVFGSILLPDPGVSPVNFLIEAIRTILGVMAVTSLALSAFLVFNTMSALMVAQVKEIGIMKAIGASTRDLLLMYLVVVAVFGLVAFAVAVLPAAWASDFFTRFIASPPLLDLKLAPFRVPPGIIALELFVSILVPLFGALPAVLGGTRISVHEAISTHGIGDRFGLNVLDRLLAHIRFATGQWILSVGNILRNKRRVVLTLGTLVLGGAVFIGVMSVRASAARTVEELGQAYRFDVEIQLAQPYRLEEIERQLAQVDDIVAVEGWGTAFGNLILDSGEEGNLMQVLAPPPGSDLTRPKIVQGRWLLPGDENALVVDSSLLREDPDISLGDTVTLRMNGSNEEWTIVGIYQYLGVNFLYVSYANLDYLARINADPGSVQRVQLVTAKHDPADQELVAQRASEHLRERGIQVSDVETSSALRNVQAEQFNIVVIVLTAMSLLITLVGGLGLAGTMSMNVLERTREVGVMRAVGAGNGAVIRIVIVEGLLMAVVSWLAAVVFAWPVGFQLSYLVGRDLVNGPLSYVYSLSGMLLWLVMVLSIAALASYGPAWRASRLTVREVLAYE